MVNKIDNKYIKKIAEEISNTSMIPYEELPKYDLFLSQVIDFLNDKFVEDKYTNNIVQNYIKSEVISKPEDGKKRGYTKIHLVQLVLLSYMRPILTTEEIKKVFSLAFNEINDRTDDIIDWESAYKLFFEIQEESFDKNLNATAINDEKLDLIIKDNTITKVLILFSSLSSKSNSLIIKSNFSSFIAVAFKFLSKLSS